MVVLEKESKALEEAEDDNVDYDQPETEQDDNVLARRHDHRTAKVGRQPSGERGLEFDVRQIAVVPRRFSKTCRFPAQ